MKSCSTFLRIQVTTVHFTDWNRISKTMYSLATVNTSLLPCSLLPFYLRVEVETDFNIFFNYGIPRFNLMFSKIISSLLSVRTKEEVLNWP